MTLAAAWARFALPASFLATLLQCSGETATSEPTKPTSLPCDVERVLASRCQECHGASPRFGAPMPLSTFADLHGPAKTRPEKKVFELVGTRTHDAARPMPPPPNQRLSSADQRILDDWIARGAPASTESCSVVKPDASSTSPTIADPPPGCPNLTLKAEAPYAMPVTTPDEYVCYGVSLTLSKKHHVVSLAPKIDNATITHHAVVYLSPTPESSVPHACNAALASGQRMIYAWAPGGAAFELPPEAGLPLDGEVHLVVQMHYSNVGALAGQSDHSSIELCATTDLRPNDADVMAFGTTAFEIPARSNTEVECELAVPALTTPLRLFRSMPHMHQVGSRIGSTRERAGEASVVIDEVSPWSFGTQPWNAIDVTVQGGDTIRTHCAWANGTDRKIRWGESTTEEMCYHFVMYWPRLTLPNWSWDTPVGATRCKTKP